VHKNTIKLKRHRNINQVWKQIIEGKTTHKKTKQKQTNKQTL